MAAVAAGCLLLVLLSLGVALGAPHATNRARGVAATSFRRWSADLFWLAGYDPFPNLTGASMSEASPEQSGAGTGPTAIRGIQGRGTSLRYAEADNAVFTRSMLEDADLTGGEFSGADFRATNLRSADLKDSTLSGANFQGADLSYASLVSVVAVGADFEGTNLYDARLAGARCDRIALTKADLRGAVLESAELNQADFGGAYVGEATLSGASLEGAHFNGAFLDGAILKNVDLRGAVFGGAILNGADLRGSDLDDADLRGVLGLTAAQICSTKSRKGAQMDDALRNEVYLTCGWGTREWGN